MRIIIATVLAILAGCDPCSAMADWHAQQCAQGRAESCAWLAEHGVVVGVPSPSCAVD